MEKVYFGIGKSSKDSACRHCFNMLSSYHVFYLFLSSIPLIPSLCSFLPFGDEAWWSIIYYRETRTREISFGSSSESLNLTFFKGVHSILKFRNRYGSDFVVAFFIWLLFLRTHLAWLQFALEQSTNKIKAEIL